MPIYLNWVVKLLADMEMYFGAVERVQSYFDIANLEHTLICKKQGESLCHLLFIEP